MTHLRRHAVMVSSLYYDVEDILVKCREIVMEVANWNETNSHTNRQTNKQTTAQTLLDLDRYKGPFNGEGERVAGQS